MRGRVRIAMTLVGISCSIVGAGTPASSAVRIDTGAVIQADAETVARIEEVFTRAEDAIAEKNLDALMAVYSEHYRDQGRTKAEMRNIWESFFRTIRSDRHAPCIFSHHRDARDPSHGRHHLHRGLVGDGGRDGSTGEPLSLGGGSSSSEV